MLLKQMIQSGNSKRLRMSILLLAMSVFTLVAFSFAWFWNGRHTSVDGATAQVEDLRDLRIRVASEDDWTHDLDVTIDSSVLEPMTTDEKAAVFRKVRIKSLLSAESESAKVYKKQITGEFEKVSSADDFSYTQKIQLEYQASAPISISPNCNFLNAETGETADIAPALRLAVYENGQCKAVWKPGDGTKGFAILEKDKPKEFLIRVWLEGTDPACINSSSGEKIQLKLEFVAE